MDVAGAVPALTFTAADPSFSIFYDADLAPASANDSTANPFVSNYVVTITGTNTDGFSRQCTWNLQIDSPCGSTTVEATDQGRRIRQRFGEPVEWYTIVPFDVTTTNAICEDVITYECVSVNRVQGSNSTPYNFICNPFEFPITTASYLGNLPLEPTLI